HIHLKNSIGKKIINIVNQGKLVSDAIVCLLVKSRINKKDCKNGFLLDGFPRTIKQAKYLSNHKIKIDYVFNFLMPNEEILKRISGRRIHKNSGRIYHTIFYPPKIKDKDDITGEELTIREDDKIEI
ncbi:MAG: nucleoside monophosphate kinase, partial [Buchnera aphidicola]|nr:nucleoside monophosphate kinase [Buchnera aphidicola]